MKHRLRGGEHRAQRKDKENVPAHALRGEPAARAEQHRCRLDEQHERAKRELPARKAERQQPSRAGRAHQEYEQAAEECGSRRALHADARNEEQIECDVCRRAGE